MSRLRIQTAGAPRKDESNLTPDEIIRKDRDRVRQTEAKGVKRERVFVHLGGECSVCGTPDFLDVHHQGEERVGKKTFSLGDSWSMSWEKMLPELDKCILLCREDHIQFHEDRGEMSAARFLRSGWNQHLIFTGQAREVSLV